VNQNGAEVRGGGDAAGQELAEMRERMAVIKVAAVESDRKWISPWHAPDGFDLKQARLRSASQCRVSRLPGESPHHRGL
jgi:hypothetical protein